VGKRFTHSEAILNYQRSLLRSEHVEWTCVAGYKLFLRVRAWEILDLQHGAHRPAHHGRDAGRSLSELSQEVLSAAAAFTVPLVARALARTRRGSFVGVGPVPD